MLRKIALVLTALIAGLLGYAATRPDSFRIERNVTIDAPPERIFPLMNDYRGWELWSPWDKRDPGMQRTYSGTDTGVGAVYEWSGNSAVGSGRMDEMVGGDFEAGLATLKAVAEQAAREAGGEPPA